MKLAITLGAIAACGASLLAAPASSAEVPTTRITVNGDGGDRVYGGVGAILGGGGNARYLDDYPAAQRKSILEYLFKPGYGASLQLLKLEIGGDGNSTDGSEPSIEHTRGRIHCGAGYEFEIARQALAIDPKLRLYGLQWGAPGWVRQKRSRFTRADIRYLLDWLGCAARNHLRISYLGGWNEADNGRHASWFHRLRRALDSAGYGHVKVVAGDSVGASEWAYSSNPGVAVLGAHNNCGYPTGVAGAHTTCTITNAAVRSGKPLWASELGAMDAGAQTGCTSPCAPAMDLAFVREYIDARVTGALEWPVIDSMPADVLPYENRGLITADQPWSGHYSVNAMTWAIAHITQFAWPPTPTNPGGWRYIDSASGYLQRHRADGAYITLLRSTRDQWSTIIETTAVAAQPQLVKFTIKGGHNIAAKTVHVWASNFNSGSRGPSQWFIHQADIKPRRGRFSLLAQPGYVYSLTTTTRQGKGDAGGPSSAPLTLPYHNELASGTDGEPSLLAPEDGAFELRPCGAPNGATTCTEQTASRAPVFWQTGAPRHPYAVIGSDWSNYTLSCDVMVPHSGSAGLIGRYDAASASPGHGEYNAYVFDVNTAGAYRLALDLDGTEQPVATGTVPFAAGVWHTLTLSLSGTGLVAGVDGQQVAAVSDAMLGQGMPGIETGGWYPAQFSNLTVSSP